MPLSVLIFLTTGKQNRNRIGSRIGSGFQADKLGRQGNAIAYTYDSEGRRTGEEVHDPQNALTRYAGYGYDDNGRLHKLTLPGDAKESAKYDLVGNIVGTKKTGVKFLLKFPITISCRHPHKSSHERIYHGFAWSRAKY